MRRLGPDLCKAGHEGIHLRERGRDEHPDVFARCAQRLRKRKAAPKGVAVSVLVTEDQDLLVGVDQLLDLVINVRRLLSGGYAGSSGVPSAGSTSFSNSEMWTAYSIDESSSNRSSGENLRF